MSEQLLSTLDESPIAWFPARHSFTNGVLVITNSKVVFLSQKFGDIVDEKSWSLQDCTIELTESLGTTRLNLQTSRSILQERFEVKKSDGESFQTQFNMQQSGSEAPEQAKEQETNPLPTEQRSLDIQEAEPVEKKSSIESPKEEDTEQPETELEKQIKELAEEMTNAFPWPTKMGCLLWVFITIGSFVLVYGNTESIIIGGTLSVICSFLGLLLFGFLVSVGQTSFYKKVIKPKTEQIMISYNLSIEEFVDLCTNTLGDDSSFPGIIREEEGLTPDPDDTNDTDSTPS